MNETANHNGVGEANGKGLGGPVNGVNGVNGNNDHFDRTSMLGSLHQSYDEEPAPPLLWFHSVPEAWVSSLSQLQLSASVPGLTVAPPIWQVVSTA